MVNRVTFLFWFCFGLLGFYYERRMLQNEYLLAKEIAPSQVKIDEGWGTTHLLSIRYVLQFRPLLQVTCKKV